MPTARSTREDGPDEGKAAHGTVSVDAPPSSLRPSLRSRSMLRTRPEIPPRHPLLLPLCAAYALAVFAWCLLRYRHFGAPAYELGAYHSLLWNLGERGTPWNSLERAHQWSIHLEPGVFWIAALYRLAPSPVWLWITESLACAAAALPVDSIARRTTGDPVVGLLAAAAMLFAPQMVLGQLSDFHTLAICALPLAVVAWAVEVDSSRALALGALGAVLLREQMGFVVAAAAVLWAVRQGPRRVPPAVVLAIAGIGISLLEIFVVIPAFGGGQSFHMVAHYGKLGSTAGEALQTAASQPGILARAFQGGRRTYLLELASGALPLLMLSLRSFRRSAWPLVLALPQIGLQLLSTSELKWSVHSPYGVCIVPLLAVAAVLALRFVPAEHAMRRAVAAGWLVLSALHLGEMLPSPVGPGAPDDPAFAGSPRAAALARAIAAVPPDASISAQDDLVPHVAARAEVHRYPDGRSTDDYVMLDLEGAAPNLQNKARLAGAVRLLRADPHFRVVVDEAGVVLAKRQAQ
jgi:uncharacterized membrane protein